MKLPKWLFYLSTIVFFNCLTGCAEETMQLESEQQEEIEFEVYLKTEMERQNMPALSVLIFKGTEIVCEKNLGFTNLEEKLELTATHPFLLASISKTVTATALFQLYDQGFFELDDSINDYLSFDVTHPDFATPITFRMLLTHTASIADGNSLDGQYYDGKDSPVALSYFMKNYFTKDGEFYDYYENFYEFEPGTEHEYSNTGAALIGVLVEEIAQMDFNTYCKQHIFQPLGMQNTFWRLDEINQAIVQPYEYANGQYNAIEHYTFTDYPNGGLRSTAQDMFRFLSAYANEGQFNNYQLIEPSTAKAVISPQIPSLEMGLHFFQVEATHNLWGHDGGEKGTSTIMGFNPTTKVGVLVFTNRENVDLEEILVGAYLLGE